MKKQWMARLLMLGIAVTTATADVLDDLGVTAQQIATASRLSGFGQSGWTGRCLLDFSLTDEHAVAIATELTNAPGDALSGFYEVRGDYARALEAGRLAPFGRVRLLARSGRTDEARAALSSVEFQRISESLNPELMLFQACQPLEDSQAWDELRVFLSLLSERLKSPSWRAALWAEELDIAWHLDRVQPLLDDTADDPRKLAFFHHRLGNQDERDRLIAGLLENTSPGHVTDLLGLLRNCLLVRNAAISLWNDTKLGEQERVALCSQLILLTHGGEFEETFRAWLAKGGDAMSLAETIWRFWSPAQMDTLSRGAVLKELHRRHPDEPRFQLLLGRQVMKSDPALAAKLFESVAGQAFVASPEARPEIWMRDGMLYIAEETRSDLPFHAIRGLGLLNRQDRVRAVLDQQTGWANLPSADQVRYLAAGGMDFEMVKAVTKADYTNPTNDTLANWLRVVLESRLKERALPRKTAAEIAAEFDVLVAGSVNKIGFRVSTDATELLDLLGREEIDADLWKQSIGRLSVTIGRRNEKLAENLLNSLGGVAARHPGLKGVLPERDKPANSGNDNFAKGMAAWSWLTLFSPPTIRRIAPVTDRDLVRPSYFNRRLDSSSRTAPLNLLDRWSQSSGDHGPYGLQQLGRPLKKEDQAIVQSLMRHFGTGSPRRLIAEILIASGLMECGDETLKAESQASMAALMAGEKETRGTEAFRFTSHQVNGAAEDHLRKVLADVKKQPPSARDDFVRQLRPDGADRHGVLESARSELGLTNPKPPNTAPKPDDDGKKLRDLQRRNLTASPEAVELAKRLLGKELERESDKSAAQDLYSVVNVLQITGMLDAWLLEAREKMLQSGVSEVEALRRIRKIDQRQTSDGTTRSLDYARKILDLDPTDSTAAQQLLPVAEEEENRKLLLKCIRALGANGISQLLRGGVLDTFGKDDAALVFSIVREQEFNGRKLETEAFGELHRYFLFADPGMAAEFRDWFAARSGIPRNSHLLIAGQLLDSGRGEDAVDVIARVFVTAREYPGFPYQFPPKPGTSPLPFHGNRDVSNLEPDLAFLQEKNLLGPVIARIEVLGDADPVTLATFQMAASPDPATFERHALPVLGKMEQTYRTITIQRWFELFAKQAGKSALMLRLLEERSKEVDEQQIYQLTTAMEQAAMLPGGPRLIAEQWARLSKAVTDLEDPTKKESLSRSMQSVLRPMLILADDDTWRDYWNWRNAIASPLGQLDYAPFPQAPTTFIDPARLRQILPRVLTELGGQMPPAQSDGWALAAVATGDRALIEKVKAAVPEECRSASELCELGLGNIMAVSPMLGAAQEANGDTLLWWNLVVVPPVDRESGGNDIPRCPFPALDGKFDLQIMAGSQPDRQVVIRKLSAVNASGSISLKLPPDHHYVAMLATEAATGVVRWTRTLDVHSGGGLPLPLAEKDLADRGFEKLAWNGPGDLPAWKVRFSGRDRIDLLDRPWNGLEPVSLGAWVSGDGKLELRCLDATGRDLQSLELIAWDAPLPTWQFRSVRVHGEKKLPAQTVRLVLSASVHGFNDGPLDFAISNIRMEIGAPPALPKGYGIITRLSGASTSIALSPDARQLAVGLDSGKLVIVDLDSREVTEIPLRPAPQGKHGRILRMTWGATGIHALQWDGFLYRVDGKNPDLIPILSLSRGNYQTDSSSFELSEDEKWIVWRDSNRGLMLASTDGTIRRKISTNSSERFELSKDGLHFPNENGQRFLLKTSDFHTGEPIEDSGWIQHQPESHPAWKDRLRFGRADLSKTVEFDPIPSGGESVAISDEGLLYYVDRAGNLMRVTP